MRHRKTNFVNFLIISFFLYLFYQIYNFSYDIKYQLFGTLEINAATSIFLFISILNIVINFILIMKLYYLKPDSILWVDIFFGYNILEILIATFYLILALSSINWFSPLDTIKVFGGRTILILLIIAIVWIVSRTYLKKELKN